MCKSCLTILTKNSIVQKRLCNACVDMQMEEQYKFVILNLVKLNLHSYPIPQKMRLKCVCLSF